MPLQLINKETNKQKTKLIDASSNRKKEKKKKNIIVWGDKNAVGLKKKNDRAKKHNFSFNFIYSPFRENIMCGRYFL